MTDEDYSELEEEYLFSDQTQHAVLRKAGETTDGEPVYEQIGIYDRISEAVATATMNGDTKIMHGSNLEGEN